ncbi:hypothetical protein [Pedobacter sp. ASV28]|uniref:hypothetical protein n=1 Tax=Pedobacter sp. ASV28 TaxID=2795123 RepID=UPI0018ECDE57|nr:hypothetical protein [Pedobacter sp. ASV28]
MQKKKYRFLKQLFAIVMLGVFSLAITPWNALHHHEDTPPVVEKNCTHKVHVKTETENCLICKAHFEKNFTADFYTYLVHLNSKLVESIFPLVGSLFTELITTSLRGPPALP